MSVWGAARHPLCSCGVVVPLLIIYEAGQYWRSQHGGSPVRCGAEAALREAVQATGWPWPELLPLLVVLGLVGAAAWRWGDRPSRPLAVIALVLAESAVWASALWLVGRNFPLLLERWGVPLSIPTPDAGQLLGWLGAGIYEEVLFRWGLFSLLAGMLRLLLLPRLLAVPMAAVAAAVLFAAAHHWGPWGEPWRIDHFLFRLFAGVYFTVVYLARGLGASVGAHVGYNLLAGLTSPAAA